MTINQAAGQADPTNTLADQLHGRLQRVRSPNFATGDVTSRGTAGGTKTATVTGSGTTYNVAVTGMTTSGTVIASIAAGVATDAAGNGNAASTSTDNTVTWDVTAPTVTINQAAGQADPTNASPINFTVVFSESVTGFDRADVTLERHVGRRDDRDRHRQRHDLHRRGHRHDLRRHRHRHRRRRRGATDAAGNSNTASTSTDNTVTYDTTAPTVTINQAAGQADPTNASPINFTVVFSESVTGFTAATSR